jgi:hypothetical protein
LKAASQEFSGVHIEKSEQSFEASPEASPSTLFAAIDPSKQSEQIEIPIKEIEEIQTVEEIVQPLATTQMVEKKEAKKNYAQDL